MNYKENYRGERNSGNLFSGAQRCALRLEEGDYGGSAPVIPLFQRMQSIRTPENNQLLKKQLPEWYRQLQENSLFRIIQLKWNPEYVGIKPYISISARRLFPG
jgi:hypothetical protein